MWFHNILAMFKRIGISSVREVRKVEYSDVRNLYFESRRSWRFSFLKLKFHVVGESHPGDLPIRINLQREFLELIGDTDAPGRQEGSNVDGGTGNRRLLVSWFPYEDEYRCTSADWRLICSVRGNSSSATSAIRARNRFWKIAMGLSRPPLFHGLMLSVING